MNSTGMSFGGGFASGLAQVLGQRRQEKLAAQERQINNTWKSIQFLLDSGQVGDVADLQPHFDTLAQMGAFGDPKAKGKKGQPGVQDHAANILGMVLNQKQSQPGGPVADPNQAGLGPDDGGQTPPPQMLDQLAPRNLSFPTSVTPPRTLNGIPLLTQEQAVERKVQNEGTAIMAKVNLARQRILPALQAVDPSATLDDALAAVGIRPSQAGQYAPSFQEVSGKMPDGSRVTGVLDARRGMFVDPITKEPLAGFVKDEAGAGARMGTNREAIAISKFGKRFSELTQPEAQQVMQAEQDYLAQTAQSRVEGAGTGKMNTPADLDTARQNNVPVGTTSAEVAGQSVPDQATVDRSRSIANLKTELGTIRDLAQKVLPSQASLAGGLVPGAVIGLRRRDPRFREDFASLDAAMSNIVNALARSVGEQRGTQTEKDAERAYQTVLSIQGDLLSPTKGDTQESAIRRLDETMKYLDVVLSNLPQSPTPNKNAAPATRPNIAAPGRTGKPTPGADAIVPGLFITPDGKLVRR